MTIYQSVNGIAEKAEEVYAGVSDTATRMKRGYMGVNGVARKVFEAADRILPAAYQQVEYITNDNNKSAYINTGYSPLVNADNSVIVEMSALWPSLPSSAMNLFGTRSGSIRFGFGKDSSHNWRFGYSSFSSSSGTKITVDTRYDILATYERGTQTLDVKLDTDTEYTRRVTKTETTAFTADVPFYIWRFNYSTPEASYARIYSCKIYANGTLVRNFYPCYRKSDDVIGMFDIIGREFYTNANSSGSFTKGPNYEQQL